MAFLATACVARADRRSDTATDAATTAAAAAAAVNVTDDAGFAIHLAQPARRVISLVPSATEALLAIGARAQIVGRTRYDVEPDVAAVPSVGGGVDPSIEAMVHLAPDLVISWESDPRQQVREKLLALGIPVFILRTQDTTDIFHGILTIGRLVGHDSAATAVVTAVRASLDSVRRSVSGRPTPTVLFVVSDDPPMTAGPNAFISQLISVAGGRSIFADATQPWPTVSMEQIIHRDPDVLLAPIGERSSKDVLARFRALPGWRDLRAVRSGHVIALPSDLMNRPSPSIAEAARVLRDALHPEVTPGEKPR
jgi:iron complex transport system substrate-binding protein